MVCTRQLHILRVWGRILQDSSHCNKVIFTLSGGASILKKPVVVIVGFPMISIGPILVRIGDNLWLQPPLNLHVSQYDEKNLAAFCFISSRVVEISRAPNKNSPNSAQSIYLQRPLSQIRVFQSRVERHGRRTQRRSTSFRLEQ